MSGLRRLLPIIVIALLASAYAGSRDSYFAGTAGPYSLRVVVHTPGVIPGLAGITVAVANPEEITQVSVQPIFWNVPADHAPAPDIARRAQGGEFHANLWLMVAGSYGVRVTVQGSKGDGTVVVPVSAVAYERLDMSRGMGVLLLSLALFLGAGLVTIVRSGAREGALAAGASVTRREKRRGWIGLGVGSLLVLGVFAGGRGWWSRVDRAYRGKLYHAPETLATVVTDPMPTLRIAVRDSSWVALRHRRPLLPDGQKSAHIFLLGDNAFAHLHPTISDSAGWQATLPPLPSGSYQVFTEVADSSGFTETLISSVQIPLEVSAGKSAKRESTGVDGFWFVDSDQRDCIVISEEYPCRRMKNDVSITLRTDRGFVFEVRALNDPVAIDWSEPEAADAFILKTDGEVVHLRPHGTMPAAAITHFGGTVTSPAGAPGIVEFPYPLPTSTGERVWVSVHAGGKRLVAEYDLAAESP